MSLFLCFVFMIYHYYSTSIFFNFMYSQQDTKMSMSYRRQCRYILCVCFIFGLTVILRDAHVCLDGTSKYQNPSLHDVIKQDVTLSDVQRPNIDRNVPNFQIQPSRIKLDKEYAARRQTMLDACAGREFDKEMRGNSSQDSVKDHIVVDRNHRILYCAIEKVGSTFWRRLWQVLTGLSSAAHPYDIPPGAALGGGQETLKNIFFDEIHSMISTYRSFIITRHPFYRIFSGYVDKLFSPNPMFWNSLGVYIIENFREEKRKQNIACGSGVTFREFVKYLIHSETHNSRRNGHFLPMFDHCRPCQIKYDVIGKMESFVDDTLYIVKSLGFTDMAFTLNKTMRSGTVSDTIKDQVNILYAYKSSICISFYDAQKIMWKKFQIRGVISKHSKFPFSRTQAGNVTQRDYITAVTSAIGDARDKARASQYRQEAFLEAFRSVDKNDMKKLIDITRVDCEVFGYDCSLSTLYHKFEDSRSDTKYFDIDQ
ncbi:carbohydrate sulfotransferase 11-like [Argopecten irradians]|uniref:carbohydrate sulfotransferase 11-like n=1 Tax=Argopecten irradians TaxID=31199 RepID=UPI00371F138B